MPSSPRDMSAGFHHVWVNATGNWAYFLDDIDRLAWIRRFVRTCRSRNWIPVAFCQMTTHVHAIVDTPDESLPRGMEYLNREYGKDFNTRHDRFGTLVRKRYGSRRIETGQDLLGAYAYVVLNPVREGMCPRAEDWRWSSYATTIDLSKDFPFVDASRVVDELGGSVDALRRLVETRAAEPVRSRHVR